MVCECRDLSVNLRLPQPSSDPREQTSASSPLLECERGIKGRWSDLFQVVGMISRSTSVLSDMLNRVQWVADLSEDWLIIFSSCIGWAEEWLHVLHQALPAVFFMDVRCYWWYFLPTPLAFKMNWELRKRGILMWHWRGKEVASFFTKLGQTADGEQATNWGVLLVENVCDTSCT